MRTVIKKRQTSYQLVYMVWFYFLVFISLFISLLSPPNLQTAAKWLIVIDPGHGGRDPGALGSFSKKKISTWRLQLKTGEYIEKTFENVKVIYTRRMIQLFDLIERPAIANRNNANLSISIHSNATRSQRTLWEQKTYIMGLTSNQDNLEVAMRENEVMLLWKMTIPPSIRALIQNHLNSYIIFSLIQNVYQKQSLDLAWKIQTHLLKKVDRKVGELTGRILGVYNTSMPSVLIETGFITNTVEER